MLRVEYQDEGWMLDRDAYFWRVRFVRGGQYLGVALGAIDGRSLMGMSDPDEWGLAGPLATANRLRDAALNGSLRTEWSVEADVLRLTVAELSDPANQRSEQLVTGTIIQEYDV